MISVGVHAAPLIDSPRQEPAAGLPDLPPGEGSEIVRERCLACHDRELIVSQRLSPDAWGRELDKMVGWGAAIDGLQRGPLLDYLSAHFGDSTSARGPVSSAGPAAELVARRCLMCHDERLIDQQRLTASGWARTVEKMIGWGASLTDSEKTLLIEDLATLLPASRSKP
jgi:mono/diheme cytochrome c family protein